MQHTFLAATTFSDANLPAQCRARGLPGDCTDWFSNAGVTCGPEGTFAIPAHGHRVRVR